jgi:uncharacterized protein
MDNLPISRTNHLIKETSPYLQQHAHNPVDWYPWGDEALERARSEDRPILLSIGYSACHWCHVMAHESFENEAIALLMNNNFINIKVDREERPDLDAIYMEAVQSLTGAGGWPLTVFLTPDMKPFYGGTYFPPEDRPALPGFPSVLKAVADAYKRRRGQVVQASTQMTAALNKDFGHPAEQKELAHNTLETAYLSIRKDFDSVNGGFGPAPKFPQPLVLEFLLRHYYRTGNQEALEMAAFTLDKMAGGGIYDQLGGGFHRYSTDSRWLVPHFEKMLYDNALLSRLYLHAYLVTRKPLFKKICEGTLDYILREMTGPQGYFYSSQDADSEGEEGKYYVWTLAEIQEALGEKNSRLVSSYYGVSPEGNFEGRNILHIVDQSKAGALEVSTELKNKLLTGRGRRVRPDTDRKMLASWNALVLDSLSEAAGALNRSDYLIAAEKNASFLMQSLTVEGYLKHVYHQGQFRIEGYLEDYAGVIEGILKLQISTFSGQWLIQAVRLADIMIGLFWSEAEGLFYDNSSRHQTLVARPRSLNDGALPSGASTATWVLMKIAWLTGDERMSRIAIRSLQLVQSLVTRYPLGFANWLCALDFYLSKSKEIILVGPREFPDTQQLFQVLSNSFLPHAQLITLDPREQTPPFKVLEYKSMINNQPTVYLCENYTCRTPVTDPESLKELLP